MKELYNWLVANELMPIIISICGTALTTILIFVKTKKSALEKKLYKSTDALINGFNSNDYYAIINGKYYNASDIIYEKKEIKK